MSGLSPESGGDEPAPPVNIKSGEKAAPEGDTYFKKCPACGKFNRDAEVCRHCGRDLVTGLQPSAKATFSRDERKVAAFVSGLAALTAAGNHTGVLPPLASIPVIVCCWCDRERVVHGDVASNKTRRQDRERQIRYLRGIFRNSGGNISLDFSCGLAGCDEFGIGWLWGA